ncbi:MAG: alpha/beta hydrolase [Acidimicrobiales bacterium]
MAATEDQLNVEDSGNPDGPPVLFLHGFMSSNLQWEPNRAGLGAELRLLLAEQPGHGRSPGPDDPAAYRAETVLDQLDRIRIRLGIDRWWLVGQSLGGAVLMRYALRQPDRVAGLIFTNSRAVFGLAGRQAPEDELDGSAEGQRGGSGLPAEPTREVIRALPYHPSNAKRIPPQLQARMIETADAMPMAVFRHMRTGGPWNSNDELHLLEVPTLLINGRFEKAFQPCVEEARAAVRDLRVVDLDGGHSVNIDQPQAFNQAVLDFIHSQPHG